MTDTDVKPALLPTGKTHFLCGATVDMWFVGAKRLRDEKGEESAAKRLKASEAKKCEITAKLAEQFAAWFNDYAHGLPIKLSFETVDECSAWIKDNETADLWELFLEEIKRLQQDGHCDIL